MITIQQIFEMRRSGQIEEAYEAARVAYKSHHGHYTTLCMFWTAIDMADLQIQRRNRQDARLILLALCRLYPSLQDADKQAIGKLNLLIHKCKCLD